MNFDFVLKELKEKELQKEIAMRNAHEFGKEHKIHHKTMKSIMSYFGEDWEEIIHNNPYRVMEIDGFGFRRADNIAKKIGYPLDSPNRIRAYVELAIMDSSNGSTVILSSTIMSKIGKELEIDNPLAIIEAVFDEDDSKFLMLDSNFKRTKELVDCMYMTSTMWFDVEKKLFETMKVLSKMDSPIKDNKKIDIVKNKLKFPLNNIQEQAVERILDKNITVLIGLGGTGKSYTTKSILDVLDAHHLTYTLMTPTGIASSVLSEKTSRNTATIHARYYERDWGNDSSVSPIKDDYIIIDEFGMCGVDHIKMILDMIRGREFPPKLLLIGDVGQLASISAGDFLNNIINLIKNNAINGQIIELTEIMRTVTDSYIPHVCKMFYGKNKFDSSILHKEDLAGVQFIPLNEENMCEQIYDIVERMGFDIDETSIILPQKVGEYGCNAVNEFFQAMNISPIAYEDKYKKFKVNDSLMHTKNNRIMGIYNGERINLKARTSYGEYMCTKLSDYTNLSYDEDTLKEQTMLSYANTTFKLQGCTSKNVIFVCNYDRHAFMLNKNLVYTSMSRASDNLIVLYKDNSLEMSSYKSILDKRKTFLGKIVEMYK